MLIPVVLAGGIGSRLWPVSRALMPKQFVNFPGQRGSLFQATLQRLDTIDDLGAPLVVCNTDHRFLVAEQLRQLELTDSTILLEPVGRNTAPAVALAALCARQSNPDAIVLVLPADHLIQDKVELGKAIAQGLDLARAGRLVTFGIVPSNPETGYGYIEAGDSIDGLTACDVARFIEKPDRDTAESFLARGGFFWNSGMFMFGAERYLQELQQYAPDIYSTCHSAFSQLKQGDDFATIPEHVFAECRADSIDYAVMEHTNAAAVIPLDAGWNDLGSWDALWDVSDKDQAGNVISGDVVTKGVENCLIQSHSRLVAAVGISNAVIVETDDAVLVANKNSVQSVKALVAQLQDKARGECVAPALVRRPWGSYQTLVAGAGYQVKHIVVNAGAALSLQMHHQRAEHWTVIKGTCVVTRNDEEFELSPDESTYIPVGARHRLSNNTSQPVEIIEVQIGAYLGEDDIVRFEDRYGRMA